MNIYNKTYLTLLIIVLTFFTIINFTSCDDGPTEPEVEPGSRDYTWEVDTLNIPFTFLQGIWGSAPNDIWAIGPGGGLDRTIYHFDGVNWSSDGISRSISPLCVWGFDRNDVWLGGYEGKIWHYNGGGWSEKLNLNNSGFAYSGFQSIWGESNENIWAVGFLDSANTIKGLVYHYDGAKWSRVNINFEDGNFLKIKRGLKTNNNYYLWGIRENNFNGDTTKLFEFNGVNTIKEISKSIYGNGKWQFVQEIDDEIVFTINNQLFTYEENNLKLLTTNNLPNSYQSIFGRNKKDVFWLMQDGIAHYNGNNIEYILNTYPTHRLTDGVLFKNEIFFLAVDFTSSLNIIYHGSRN